MGNLLPFQLDSSASLTSLLHFSTLTAHYSDHGGRQIIMTVAWGYVANLWCSWPNKSRRGKLPNWAKVLALIPALDARTPLILQKPEDDRQSACLNLPHPCILMISRPHCLIALPAPQQALPHNRCIGFGMRENDGELL